MSEGGGQAVPRPRRRNPALLALRWLLGSVLGVLLVAGVALGWLAVRLAEAPVPVDWLARAVQAAFDAGPGRQRVEVGGAAIGWGGWHAGLAAPLDIRLSGLRLLDPDGTVRAAVPAAAVTLSLPALLRGVVAPTTLELRGATMLLVREADGTVHLDRPGTAAPPAAADPTAADPAAPEEGDILAELMRPPSDRAAHTALRRVQVSGGEVVVQDALLGTTWTLADPQLSITREAAGGLRAEGSGTVWVAGQDIPVTLSGSAEGTPPVITTSLSLPALHPAALARAVPALAPLARLDAPVSLTATALLDAEGRPRGLRGRLEAGAGAAELGSAAAGLRIPFAALVLAVEGGGDALRLPEARLTLPGAEPGRPGPALAATGSATRREGGWEVVVEAGLDPAGAGDLGRLWPEGLRPRERAAALATVLAGTPREARLTATLRVPETLDGAALREARLGLAVADLVLEREGRRIALDAVELAAQLTPDTLRLERLVLRPARPGREGGPRPTLTGDGEAQRAGGRWRGALRLGLDAMPFAELGAYWPAGAAQGAREWITRNVTAGTARNGRWRLEAEAPETLDEVRLTGLTGTVEAADATVHWLRPVPPLLGAAGVAEFSLNDIVLRARSAHQARPDGRPGVLEAREATARFLEFDRGPGRLELTAGLVGPLAEVVTLLKHPRLRLFERRPLELEVGGGTVDTRLEVGLPLLSDLPMDQLRLRARSRLEGVRLIRVLVGQDIDRGAFDMVVDPNGLQLNGTAEVLGAPARLEMGMGFRPGPPTQVTERATLRGTPDAARLADLGLDAGTVLEGPLDVTARYERRRSGAGTVQVRADLLGARLALAPLGWQKPPGSPGLAEGTLRLQGDTLTAVENLRVQALELALRGRAAFGRGAQLDRVEITEAVFGGSRLAGEVRRPAAAGGPWQVALRGPLLDLRPLFGPSGHQAGGAARERTAPPDAGGTGPAVQVDVQFDRVTMGEARNLFAVTARARTDPAGVLREARASARTAADRGAVEFGLTPDGQRRVLELLAEDGGALLRALDLVQPIQGGRLQVQAAYEELRPGAPLTGTATLENFVVRDAPTVAKVLQGMTLYGLVDAVRGGNGLVFAQLVAPFTLTSDALAVDNARAFSASLGVTARGRVLRERPVLDLEGTIVPAYMFNALLGNIPLLGRIFSPEAGGGVFAATWRVRGTTEAPQVTINPLAALTPGFLRGLFGLVEGRAETDASAPVQGAPAAPAPPAAPAQERRRR